LICRACALTCMLNKASTIEKIRPLINVALKDC
jgi:hypothetical protein